MNKYKIALSSPFRVTMYRLELTLFLVVVVRVVGFHIIFNKEIII